jgi:hypothetical protein
MKRLEGPILTTQLALPKHPPLASLSFALLNKKLLPLRRLSAASHLKFPHDRKWIQMSCHVAKADNIPPPPGRLTFAPNCIVYSKALYQSLS